jgi:hypothetical protein
VGTSQKRDADVDRLLRAVLKPAPRNGPGDCPDAGVLAAFTESGLTATEQSAVEAHLAGCGRCQEALAVISDHLPEEPAAEAASPESRWFTWVTRPRLRWLVPISAAATVAVVIFATRPLIAPESEEVFPADVVQMAQAPPPPAALPAAGVDTLREKPAAVPEKREAADTVRRDDAAKSLVGQAQAPKESREVLADAAQAGAPARLARNFEAGLVTVSAPGGTVLWRFGAGGQISRSADGGALWQPRASGVRADLLAGSAPSSDVCWIAGSAGTVLLTSDGEQWKRLSFPLAVDLVAVEASDGRAATVTTRDGRRFETLDAGLSWSQKQ